MKVNLLHEIIKKSAKLYPEKIAVEDNFLKVTYKLLDEKSEYLSSLVFEYLRGEKDAVGVFTDKSVNAIIAFLGVLKAGSAYVPIDTYYFPKNRVKKIIFLSEMKLILTDDKNYNEILEIVNEFKHDLNYKFRIINLDKLEFKKIYKSHKVSINENDLAYILYTSGSTGTPKGVMISHLNACTFINWAFYYFKSDKSDIFSNFASFSFDLSVFDIYVSMISGAKLCIIPNNIVINPKWVLKWIIKKKITIIYTVPFLWINILDYMTAIKFDICKLKKILFAGEVFNPKYLKKLMDLIPNARYYNLYGPTETNVCTCYEVKSAESIKKKAVPIGYVCEGLRAKVLDINENEVKVGETGELMISGNTVTKGYYKNSELSKEIFITLCENEEFYSYYKTGDIVRRMNSNLMEYVERKDNMIKHLGFRIEMNEIISTALMFESVKEAVVIKINLDNKDLLCLAVRVIDSKSFLQINLKNFIGSKLPRYMVPDHIFVFENLPLNNNKKIDRKKIELFIESKFKENGELKMLNDLAVKYNEKKVPLYVSYPTTSWWRDCVSENEYVKAFLKSDINFAYFHFPYCRKLCYYCCCYKEVLKDENDNNVYLNYLEKEIKGKLKLLGLNRFSNIKKIHWGGGTPSLLTIEQIDRAYSLINKYIDICAKDNGEISLEAYPNKDILTFEKLKYIKSIGFTNISLGIQDFDDKIQKVINRDYKFDEVRNIIRDCRHLDFKIHIDLCYGLPYQGIKEFSKTLKKVLIINPDRISVFPYVHFPLVFSLQRLIPKESIKNSVDMVYLMELADRTLKDSGYYRIGYDHYCKKDDSLFNNYNKKMVIRDFMGQSLIENRKFMGFGVSAISILSDYMLHNVMSLDKYYEYLDNNNIPLNNKMSHKMSKDDVLREYIILKCVLTDFIINKMEIENRFKIDFNEYFKDELLDLNIYERDGLIEGVNLESVKITKKGRYFARHIAQVFDRYYK